MQVQSTLADNDDALISALSNVSVRENVQVLFFFGLVRWSSEKGRMDGGTEEEKEE